MLKYVDTKIVFQEVPNEISLAINISNCPCNCPGCHSAYLAEDIGKELTEEELNILIASNEGISCVCFMGGDREPYEIKHMASYIRNIYPSLKIAWYSGKDTLPSSIELNIHNFDYIKLGPYIEELGPLNSKYTNQRFYEINNGKLIDKTYLFWNKELN